MIKQIIEIHQEFKAQVSAIIKIAYCILCSQYHT